MDVLLCPRKHASLGLEIMQVGLCGKERAHPATEQDFLCPKGATYSEGGYLGSDKSGERQL